MSCVPIESRKFEPGPQEYLTQLLALISTLRGGESRYLPLVKAKIRDTLPANGTALPSSFNMSTSGRMENGSPLNLRPGHEMMGNGRGAEELKQESSESSAASTPYETSPFLHFYPLA